MSSNSAFANIFTLPIMSLQYQDIAASVAPSEPGEIQMEVGEVSRAEVEMTQAEFAARIRKEREEAASLVDQRLRQEYEQKAAAARAAIAATVAQFEQEREDYFTRVESEVVQLALSIAAKIMHREAQVDPLLVAGIVRVAVEKMHDKTNITLRVGAGNGSRWKQFCAATPSLAAVDVREDAKLSNLDCILETHLGSANLGMDAQLKEIEQGFCDLMALRPTKR